MTVTTLLRTKSQKVALTGLLGALALVLSYFEGLLPPFPLMPPGAKPGFSNIATMFTADTVGMHGAVFVGIIKGVFTLFTRGVTAGLMSLCGGILSAVTVAFLFKRTSLSYIMVGILGAVLHNIAQLCVSLLLIGSAMIYYFPALLLFALISGSLTGLITGFTVRKTNNFFSEGGSIGRIKT